METYDQRMSRGPGVVMRRIGAALHRAGAGGIPIGQLLTIATGSARPTSPQLRSARRALAACEVRGTVVVDSSHQVRATAWIGSPGSEVRKSSHGDNRYADPLVPAPAAVRSDGSPRGGASITR